MIAKCFEIRDRATLIPVVALSTEAANEGQGYLLRRAGYSPDGSTIVLVRLTDCEGSCDPYGWGGRTMPVAHGFIERHFHELEDGAVVDVEFVLGETTEAKRSERDENPA